MPISKVMSEILTFFKVLKGLICLKTRITWVIFIAQKSYSTLQKALDIGNLSLESIQNQNPILKTIKMKLKLIGWEEKSNFHSIFLYYLIINRFLAHKL